MFSSRVVLFFVSVALALSCFIILVYYLWSISYESVDDYEFYEEAFETKSIYPATRRTSTPVKHTELTTSISSRPKKINITLHRNYNLFNNDNCGFLTQHGMRIIGGHIARPMSNPWIAVLFNYYESTNTTEFACAGTLISDNLVLTAAHCVHKQSTVLIRLGEQNFKTNPDCEIVSEEKVCADEIQDITDFEVLTHKYYDFGSPTDQDIALIKLKTPAKLHQNNINTICLPFPSIEKLKDNETLEVIGFGRLSNGSASDVLMKAKLPNIPIDTCQEICSRIKKGILLDQGNICAGGDGVDSCRGDSGGPLQSLRKFNKKIRMVQFGIVSAGLRDVPCGQLPGIYTRIDTYLRWILENADNFKS